MMNTKHHCLPQNRKSKNKRVYHCKIDSFFLPLWTLKINDGLLWNGLLIYLWVRELPTQF